MSKIAKLFPSLFSIPPFRLPIIIFLTAFICHALPSPDVHSAQVTLAWDANTSPGIAGYKVYYGSASRRYQVVIDAGNNTAYTISNLQGGSTYYFAVTDYNISGSESGYSNEVSYAPPAGCTYSISPTSQSPDSSGGPGTVSVTASSGCTWTSVSNASWITITSNSSVTGNGTVNYSVSANSGTTSRTGTMTIAGQTFTVTQSGSSSGSWTFCATEGQQCSFTGTKNVRYGANGVYVFKSLTNGTICNNSVFGDPLNGVVKQCYIQGSGIFTITASAGSGGTISPSGSVQIASGGSQTFTITPSTGYQLDSILVDGTNMGALATYTFSNVTANHTISASFTPSSGSWTFCATEGQQCSFTGTNNVRYGANGVYVFKSLTNGTMCVNSVFGDPLSGVVKQCYIQGSGTFTITASAGSGGTISPSGSVQIASGGSQTFTITPSTGYQLDSILVDGTNMGALAAYTFSNVTANHTISASFTPSSGSWTFCATEGQQCSFTGPKNVRYGANGVYVFKALTNGTMCSNSVFGDPLFGVVKQCYIQ